MIEIVSMHNYLYYLHYCYYFFFFWHPINISKQILGTLKLSLSLDLFISENCSKLLQFLYSTTFLV